MKEYLYLLTLRGKDFDVVHTFYATDEQEAQRKAERSQTETEKSYQQAFQFLELRLCPYGFRPGICTYLPPTREIPYSQPGK